MSINEKGAWKILTNWIDSSPNITLNLYSDESIYGKLDGRA